MSHRSSAFGTVIVVLAAVAGLVVAQRFVPEPRQYYPVETYRTRLAVSPTSMVVLRDEDRNAEGRSESTRIVESEVVIERGVPVRWTFNGGARLYDKNVQQPSADAIANAGQEFNMLVSIRSDPLAEDHQFRPDAPGATAPFTTEVTERIVAAVADDVALQSGNTEYAEAVRKGGVKGPPLDPVAMVKRKQLMSIGMAFAPVPFLILWRVRQSKRRLGEMASSEG